MTYTQKPPPPQEPHWADHTQPATTAAAGGNGTDQLYPFFDYYVPRNITTTIGQSAFLHCRTENLNDKSVSGAVARAISVLFERTINVPVWYAIPLFDEIRSRDNGRSKAYLGDTHRWCVEKSNENRSIKVAYVHRLTITNTVDDLRERTYYVPICVKVYRERIIRKPHFETSFLLRV